MVDTLALLLSRVADNLEVARVASHQHKIYVAQRKFFLVLFDILKAFG